MTRSSAPRKSNPPPDPQPAAPYPNPVLGRVNAAFFSSMNWYMHWKYRARKARLFAELPEHVVELGAGAGANFRYLRPGTTVTAIEPNPHMHRALHRNARRHGVDLEIRGVGAEGIELPDASVELVVCSLVLCTVDDPDEVLREVLRVLAPGGRFICIEHVAAPEHSALLTLQRLIYRPWKWFFEGCHTHRDTARTLEASGFSRVEIEAFTWRSAFLPVRPQIAAICTK